MIKNLARIMITILIFGFYLLLSLTAMAQSAAAPPETPDEGDRRDIGHQYPPEHPDGHTKNNPGSISDSKKLPPAATSSNPTGAKPGSSPGTDQKSPASGTGGPKGY